MIVIEAFGSETPLSIALGCTAIDPARGIFKSPIPTGVLEVEVFEDRNCRITWTAYQQDDLIYLHRLYPSVTVRDRDHEKSGRSQTFDTTVLFVSRLLIFKH